MGLSKNRVYIDLKISNYIYENKKIVIRYHVLL